MSPILHGRAPAPGPRPFRGPLPHPRPAWRLQARPPRPVLPATPGDHVRLWLAQLLQQASARLARQARELARPVQARQRQADATAARAPGAPPAPGGHVEFHAEAGAPEGMLYIDGRLVGRLDVRRL